MACPLRKILLTTPYDLAVPGGVNNQLWGLYRALKGLPGYEVRVVGPSSDPDSHDCPDLVLAGRVVSWQMNRAMSNVTPDVRIRSRIKALLREFRPDIVHLQEPLLPILNTFVLYYSRGINVGTYHTYSETSRGYYYAWPILKWHHNRVQVKIAVSEAARGFVSGPFPDTYHIIPNAVDLPVVRETVGPNDPLKDPKRTILFVGRMNEPRKGFSCLLQAFNKLEKACPGRYRLVTAGAGKEAFGPDRIMGQVEWLGRVSREALAAAYASCDILCAPSLGGESFGLVLLEALSYGKPVVASDIKGYREFVGRSGAALFALPGDSHGLAKAISAAFKDKERYAALSASALDFVQDYSWPSVVERIIGLYDSALAERERTG